MIVDWCSNNKPLMGYYHNEMGIGCRFRSTEEMVSDLKRDPIPPGMGDSVFG